MTVNNEMEKAGLTVTTPVREHCISATIEKDPCYRGN
jgi:hypothetical protein